MSTRLKQRTIIEFLSAEKVKPVGIQGVEMDVLHLQINGDHFITAQQCAISHIARHLHQFETVKVLGYSIPNILA